VLVVWDWVWIVAGGMTQIKLGISHLVIDLWWIAIVTVALKRILGVPVWLGIVLNFLSMASSMPLAIMFMRSPL
jgi:membrane protein insertase Oxa1/YidC/SpoIIIJ